MSESVLVVGGTGFIGGAVVDALRASARPGPPPRVAVLSRGPADGPAPRGGVRRLTGDLRDPRTLHGICTDVTTVVHAASFVGSDPRACRETNEQGTRALLAEAHRAGVRRLLYVGTASVYGSGPHRGVCEGETEAAPMSPASATRLEAERAVRRAGGVALRPHLVYGAGDRWFVPALVRLLREVPCRPQGVDALSSVVHVEDLARVVAALVLDPRPEDAGRVFHVDGPRPEPLWSLASQACAALGLAWPERTVSPREHRRLAAEALPWLTDHQYALLTRDHWYCTCRIRDRLALAPAPGFAARIRRSADWYRRHLAGQADSGR